MSRKLISNLVFLIFLLPFVFGSGSIQTGNMLPVSADLCGDYSQYVTITAYNITNKENLLLTSVSARLYLSADSGLSFITSQEVNIGNMNPLSQSASTPSWTLQCSSPNNGVFTAYVNYTSLNNYRASSLGEAFSTMIIHNSLSFLGNISIIESNASQGSQQVQTISDNTPTIKVMTTRNSICKGSLDHDEAYTDMDFIFYGSQKDHNYTFVNEIIEGQHSVFVRCKDEFDNLLPSPLIVNFIIDTIAPVITVTSPGSVIIGEYANLIINVNEEAECRYENNVVFFENMAAFDVVNGTTFTAQLTELEEKTYNYYVICRDKVKNTASKKLIFEVVIPPKAEIIFEKEPPLTKGTYKIRLIPSKRLRSVPSLSYTFTDDSGFNRQIGLIKEGNNYEGYIIIEEYDKIKQALFTFKGYDFDGNEGNEITTGAIFLVDTIKPYAPGSLSGKSIDDGVNLKWYYEGEKPDHFNIYRSTSQGVGLISFYDTSQIGEFRDDNVLSSQVYYYRIAAVDAAGNIGELSNEVSVYTTSGNGNAEQQITNTNPPTPQTREWKTNTEKNIDTLLIDIDWAINNLKDQATKDKSVDDLALVKQIMSTKEDIDKLKTQIKNIDVSLVSDTDLRQTLSLADAQIARTKKTAPQSMAVDKSANLVQASSSSDIELAVSELLASGNYTDAQIKSYRTEMEKINSKVKVETEVKTISIEYLDESKETKIIVTKKISYENPQAINNVILIEIIPKTVAGDVSSVDIKTPDYDVINPDPVISWTYPALSYDKQTITYVVMSNDNSESAKTTKAIVLIDPRQAIKESQGLITGFSIFISKFSIKGVEFLGLGLGIVVILGLAMYYLIVINEVDVSEYIKKIPVMKNFAQKIKPFSANKEEAKEQKIVIKSKTEPIIKTAITNESNLSNSISRQSKTQNRDFSYLFKSDQPLKTIPEQYFFVKNGDVIRSITEFADVLKKMDDFTFYYHVNEQKNDFAEWVDTIYHNKELAELIASASSRKELIQLMGELSKQD